MNKDLVYFVINPLYKENLSLRRTPPRNTKAIIRYPDSSTLWHSKLMLKDLRINSVGATSIVKRYMNPTKLYPSKTILVLLYGWLQR